MSWFLKKKQLTSWSLKKKQLTSWSLKKKQLTSWSLKKEQLTSWSLKKKQLTSWSLKKEQLTSWSGPWEMRVWGLESRMSEVLAPRLSISTWIQNTYKFERHIENRMSTSPFIFIRNKRPVTSSEGFHVRDMSSEACAAHPVGRYSPLQIVITVWRTFFLNLNLRGQVREPAADYNGCLACIYIFFKCAIRTFTSVPGATSDQITQQNSLQRAGGP